MRLLSILLTGQRLLSAGSVFQQFGDQDIHLGPSTGCREGRSCDSGRLNCVDIGPECHNRLFHWSFLCTQADKATNHIVDATRNWPERMSLLQLDTSLIISVSKTIESANHLLNASLKL